MTVQFQNPLSDADRALLQPFHRKVQAAVATLAARRLGVKPDLRGIGKWEGGVRVGGKEICLRRNNATDDWSYGDPSPTPEEEAAAVAVAEVVALVRADGEAALDRVLGAFDEKDVWFDPLRTLLFH